MDKLIERQKVEKRRKMARPIDRAAMPYPVGAPRFERRQGAGFRGTSPFAAFLPASREQERARRPVRRAEDAPEYRPLPPSVANMLVKEGRARPVSAEKGPIAGTARVIAPPVAPIGRLEELAEKAGKVLDRLPWRIPAIVLAFLVLSLAIGIAAFAEPFPLPETGVAFPREDLSRELFSYIAPVDEAMPDEDAAPFVPGVLSVREYTVRPGDSLLKIARDAGVSIDSIISLNGMTNAKRIIAGARLKLPNLSGLVHKVKKGESLEAIAKAYGTEIAALADANDLQTVDLVPGQTLFVPGAKMSASELRRALGELMIWPTTGRISSGFGYRLSPFTGIRQFHSGIDIVGPVGTPIACAMDGTVADIGYNNVFGNYVIVNHADGYQTWYAHLHKVSVKLGQKLVQGQTVGLLGNSGYTTGAHLHFSVFRYGKAMDPMRILK